MKKIERLVINLPIVSWLRNSTKKIILPGFQGVPLHDVLVFFMQQVKKIGFSERTAAISFNFLLAIPAGMIFLFTLVPYLPVSKEFIHELLLTINDILRNQKVYAFARDIIIDVFTTPRRGLLSFSFIAAIFFASNAMMGVMRTFDRSFFEERKGKFLVKRWTAIKLTSLLVLLVFVSVLLLTTQGPIKKILLNKLKLNSDIVIYLIKYIRWIIILLMNFYSIALIYKYAPAVKIKWKLLSPGAILACILTIFTSWAFSMWVNNFGKLNQLYGSIGTVLLIMNLIYFNALVLLIGFELNVSIAAIKTKNLEKSKAM